MEGEPRKGYTYRFGPENNGTIVVANTQLLREKVFKLVYDVYLSKGYDLRIGRESGRGLWCTMHSLHPDTMIFLAQKAGKPVGAVIVIPDSRLGLPSDLIFPEPLASLRADGRRLCEVSSLVVAEGLELGVLELPLHLCRLAYLTIGHLLKGTDMIASFMAHHSAFYSRFLLFDDILPDSRLSPKTGQQVRFGRLNLETMKSRYETRYNHLNGRRNLYRWFFMSEEERGVILEWLQRNRRPMTSEELQYFGTCKSNILSGAGPDSVAILMEYYRKASAVKVQV
ncbi:MAG: hypothetical protein NTZ24_08025 [Deltaproteobacteria bacterium]|nr:hypothetical protein [Deltaproteobacteria bacterium]